MHRKTLSRTLSDRPQVTGESQGSKPLSRLNSTFIIASSVYCVARGTVDWQIFKFHSIAVEQSGEHALTIGKVFIMMHHNNAEIIETNSNSMKGRIFGFFMLRFCEHSCFSLNSSDSDDWLVVWAASTHDTRFQSVSMAATACVLTFQASG